MSKRLSDCSLIELFNQREETIKIHIGEVFKPSYYFERLKTIDNCIKVLTKVNYLGKTTIIDIELDGIKYKKGDEVCFIIDGVVDEETGVVEDIRHSGHFEDHCRFDFVIKWQGCMQNSVTPLSMMAEQVRPISYKSKIEVI